MPEGTGFELILNAAEGALQILVTEDEVLRCETSLYVPERATEYLAPTLDRICQTLGVRLADFRRIACVRGPGSFTGIRLVLATAAALRRAGRARLAGLDYLQSLATTAVQHRGLLYGTPVWVLTHARRHLVHCQPFLSYGTQIPAQPLAPVSVCSPEAACASLQAPLSLPEDVKQPCRTWVCGSGLARHAEVFSSIDGMRPVAVPDEALLVALPELRMPDAASLCLLARHGDYFDRDVEPLYARACDAKLPPSARAEDTIAAEERLAALLDRQPASEI